MLYAPLKPVNKNEKVREGENKFWFILICVIVGLGEPHRIGFRTNLPMKQSEDSAPHVQYRCNRQIVIHAGTVEEDEATDECNDKGPCKI